MLKKGGVPSPKKEEEMYDAEDLAYGIEVESSEHPWMDPKTVKRLAMDHLKMDEDYYESEEDDEEKDED